MDCVKNIGCFPSCNAIKFPYPALETGVHFVIFDWLGSKKTIAFEAVEGEIFYIPNFFNESSDPVFSIKQPSGSYLCWDKELEALAVCPDNCGKDCDFYRHFTLEINETSDFPGQENEDPDLAYSDKIYNIDEAHDNGDGAYTINVMGAANGDLAVDDDGIFYEYENGIWTVKFKEVCSVEVVEELPDILSDCVLYIKDGKYYVAGEVYCPVQEPVNLFQPYFNEFGDLPQPGDPSFTYVVQSGGVALYIWRDGAYQPVYFDGEGGYPPEWTEGQYVYALDTSGAKIMVGCVYKDVTPPFVDTNLFSQNLTQTREVNHDTGDHSFAMKGENGYFIVEKWEGSDRGRLWVSSNYMEYLISSGGSISGIYLLHDINGQPTMMLLTGQNLTSLNPTVVPHFLKLVETNGMVEYQPITIPEYATDTAADNDTNLPSGGMYAVTGDRTVKRKP